MVSALSSVLNSAGSCTHQIERLHSKKVWKIEVKDLPAFVVVDNKGNDFYQKWSY